MANDNDIINKIKKCLALSKSTNEHEAAAALRQAQKLMQKHGIDDETVAFSDVIEERVSTRTKHTPPKWALWLADTCANAFACDFFVSKCRGKSSECVFIGITHNAYLAGYAYDVLLRQLKKSRKDYYTKNNKRCKQSTRTNRADLFAQGYVVRLDEKVKDFASPVPTVVHEYIAKTHSELSEIKRRKNSSVDDKRSSSGNEDAFRKGWDAGEYANLHNPVGQQEKERLLTS